VSHFGLGGVDSLAHMEIPRAAVFAVLAWIASCGDMTTSDDAGSNRATEAGADRTFNDTRFNDGPGADVDSMHCEEKTRAASALLFAAERSGGTDSRCQTNDDCRVVWRVTDCSHSCSTLTTRTIEEKIKAAIDEANATVCVGFRAAGCRLLLPPCDPPRRWVCLGTTCSIEPP
jgi:hypothetical protein